MANEYLGPIPGPLPEDVKRRLMEAMATPSPTPFRAHPVPTPAGVSSGSRDPGGMDVRSAELLKRIIGDIGERVGSSTIDTFLTGDIPEDSRPRVLDEDFGADGVFRMRGNDVLPESFRKVSRPELDGLRTAAGYGDPLAQRARMLADAGGGDIGQALMSLLADGKSADKFNEARASFAKQVDKIETDDAELSNADLKKRRINNALWSLPPDIREKVQAEYNAAEAAQPKPTVVPPGPEEEEDGMPTWMKLLLVAGGGYLGGKKFLKSEAGKKLATRLGRSGK